METIAGLDFMIIYLQKGVLAYCTKEQAKENQMRHTVDIDKLTTMFDDVLPSKCTDSLTPTVAETAQLRNIWQIKTVCCTQTPNIVPDLG